MIIAFAVLLSLVLLVLIDALFMHLTVKILKIESGTFRTALIISSIFILSIAIVYPIAIIVSSGIGLGALGNIIILFVGFFISNKLYEKYYKTDLAKNISIFFVKGAMASVGGGLAVGLLVFLPLRIYLFEPFSIQSESMSPTLKNGQYTFFKKYDKNYQREDIIVYKYYSKNQSQFSYSVSRLIGMPNEKVETRNRGIYINGKKLDEKYLSNDEETWGDVNLVLNSEEYFVLGDNRSKSSDSRFSGPVKKSDIVGKYWLKSDMLGNYFAN